MFLRNFLLISVVVFFIDSTSGQSRCTTPTRKVGTCISVYDCPELVSLLTQSVIPQRDVNFLQSSQCRNGVGRTPHVCCPQQLRRATTRRPRRPAQPGSGQGNVLPRPRQCGFEPTGNKIYNGQETLLDEFAWMAILEYQSRSGGKQMECGGALINKRYILTAAHCVIGQIENEIGPLVSVRLGEHDTRKDPDCIQDDCADRYVEVGVEEVVPHPQYVDNSNNRHHDIALIRLDRDINYTDFIKPVCLPSALNLQQSTAGTELLVAGWGRTLTARRSPTKQKLAVPIVGQAQCRQQYLTSRNVEISDSQLCAGGVYLEDSCSGDSGGPLMRFVRSSWAIEGIVSFGNRCGLEGWPAVYTRVSSYENWIRSTLKP